MTSSLAAGATQRESAAYRRRYIPAYLRSLTRGIRVPIIESAKMTDAAHRGLSRIFPFIWSECLPDRQTAP